MFRQIPVQNKLCFQREHEKNIQRHDSNIQNMKKMIDNSAPPQYGFLMSRKKKEILQQERNTEIMRNNKIMVEKIQSIISKHRTSQSRLPQKLQTHQVSTFSQTQGSTSNPFASNKTSLNKEYRKKEVVKIVFENQALLKRIQSQKSEYNVKIWEKDRHRNEEYISRISEYQYKDYRPNKTLVKLGVWSSLDAPRSSPKQSIFKEFENNLICNKQQQIKNQVESFSLSSKIRILRVLFIKTGKRQVHISTLLKSRFPKENLQRKSNNYNFEIPEEEGMEILQNECKNNPELLLERIKIDERTKSFYFKRNQNLRSGASTPDKASPNGDYKNSQEEQTQKQGNNSRVTEEREDEEDPSLHASKIESKAINKQQVSPAEIKQNDQQDQEMRHEEEEEQEQEYEQEEDQDPKENQIQEKQKEEDKQQITNKKEEVEGQNVGEEYEERFEDDNKEKEDENEYEIEIEEEEE